MMEAVIDRDALSAAVSALSRSQNRLWRDFGLTLLTVEADRSGLRMGFTDSGPVAVGRMAGTVTGEARFGVNDRLFRDIVRQLPDQKVRLKFEVGTLTIKSGSRVHFSLRVYPAPDPLPAPPAGGVVVRAHDYLRGFRRAVSMLGGHADVAEAPIRISSDADDLWLDFHTFDFAARARVPGRAGTFGASPVGVLAGDLERLISLFPDDNSLIRVVEDNNVIWIVDETPRSGASVAAAVVLAAEPGRNADPLLDLERPNLLRVSVIDLRAALRRCILTLQGRSIGRYVTFQVDAASSCCRIMTQGWFASTVEELSCRYNGITTEFAVRHADLAAAIKWSRGTLSVSFDDPERYVLISERLIYRCMLRALGPHDVHGPRYAGSANNIPFPT
jgi:hypothetical protein